MTTSHLNDTNTIDDAAPGTTISISIIICRWKGDKETTNSSHVIVSILPPLNSNNHHASDAAAHHL